MLQNATLHTRSFHGNDVRTAYQLILRVLQYESQQEGFDLAATHDVEFNQVLYPLFPGRSSMAIPSGVLVQSQMTLNDISSHPDK